MSSELTFSAASTVQNTQPAQLVKPFLHSQFGQIRVVLRDNEPWFVASDVCRVLDLDASSGLRGLDEDEKGLQVMQTPGGMQSVSVVSESGLYSFVLRSNKPNAKEFSRWVRKEVLPSIRKTGQYGTPALPQSYAEALRALAAEVEAHEATQRELAVVKDHDAKAMAVVGKLADALGHGQNMKQVKAIPWLRDYFNIRSMDRDSFWGCMGKYMVMLCDKYGYKWEEIPDSAWGKVKNYPAEAFEMLRRELDGGLVNARTKYIGKFLKCKAPALEA